MLEFLNKYGGIAGSVAACLAGVAAVWVALDYLQIRPALIREVRADEDTVNQSFKTVQLQIEQVSKSVIWLQYDQLAKKMEKIPLTVPEQHDLCQASKQLGVPPPIQGCPQ